MQHKERQSVKIIDEMANNTEDKNYKSEFNLHNSSWSILQVDCTS